jgi:aspartate racemase
MRTLALLGGMTPDVTALYYNLINKAVRAKLGQTHSAKIYIYSVDFQEQVQRLEKGQWDDFATEYVQALRPLISQQPPSVAGVALGAIVAHKVSAQVSQSLPATVEFLDVTESIAKELKSRQITTVGLFGPAVTMTDKSPDFFRGKLIQNHGLDVLVPESEEEIAEVNRGMFEEVARGAAAVTATTRQMFMSAANKLIERGVQAIILGSTDLGFVLQQEDFPDTPVLDAARLHADDLANWMLSG